MQVDEWPLHLSRSCPSDRRRWHLCPAGRAVNSPVAFRFESTRWNRPTAAASRSERQSPPSVSCRSVESSRRSASEEHGWARSSWSESPLRSWSLTARSPLASPATATAAAAAAPSPSNIHPRPSSLPCPRTICRRPTWTSRWCPTSVRQLPAAATRARDSPASPQLVAGRCSCGHARAHLLAHPVLPALVSCRAPLPL